MDKKTNQNGLNHKDKNKKPVKHQTKNDVLIHHEKHKTKTIHHGHNEHHKSESQQPLMNKSHNENSSLKQLDDSLGEKNNENLTEKLTTDEKIGDQKQNIQLQSQKHHFIHQPSTTSKNKSLRDYHFGKLNRAKIRTLPKPPSYEITYYNSTLNLFSKLYTNTSLTKRIITVIIVATVYSFSTILFVQNTGVYVSGVNGIVQGIARISRIALTRDGYGANEVNLIGSLLFYTMYFFVNIPLIIMSYKLLGKKFTLLSLIIIGIPSVLPVLINLDENVRKVFIFGDTTNPNNSQLVLLNFVDANQVDRFIRLMLYTLFAGVIGGFCAAVTYASGSCFAGLDYISFYFHYIKKKRIGKIILSVNTISVILSIFIGSFLASGIENPRNLTYYNFFSQNLISGLIYVILLSTFIRIIFPKDKTIKIQVYCEDVMAIRNYLYSTNFNHSITINTTIGGYTLQEKRNIEIVCLFIELPKIITKLKTATQKMLITVTPIYGIDGNLSVENALS